MSRTSSSTEPGNCFWACRSVSCCITNRSGFAMVLTYHSPQGSFTLGTGCGGSAATVAGDAEGRGTEAATVTDRLEVLDQLLVDLIAGEAEVEAVAPAQGLEEAAELVGRVLDGRGLPVDGFDLVVPQVLAGVGVEESRHAPEGVAAGDGSGLLVRGEVDTVGVGGNVEARVGVDDAVADDLTGSH